VTGSPVWRSGGVRLLIAPVLLMLVLAGCGGGSGGGSTTSDGGVLVRYERRGGLAYSDVVVTVREDGRAVRTSSGVRVRRTPLTLTSDQLARLRQALRDADFAHLRSSGAPTPTDGYEYTLTAAGHTVRFPQGDVPTPLVPAIALLDGRAYAA
jgi:hypothetical protein